MSARKNRANHLIKGASIIGNVYEKQFDLYFTPHRKINSRGLKTYYKQAKIENVVRKYRVFL